MEESNMLKEILEVKKKMLKLDKNNRFDHSNINGFRNRSGQDDDDDGVIKNKRKKFKMNPRIPLRKLTKAEIEEDLAKIFQDTLDPEEESEKEEKSKKSSSTSSLSRSENKKKSISKKKLKHPVKILIRRNSVIISNVRYTKNDKVTVKVFDKDNNVRTFKGTIQSCKDGNFEVKGRKIGTKKFKYEGIKNGIVKIQKDE